MNDTQTMRGRPVTYEEALASAIRISQGKGKRCIPVCCDDDDVVVDDYITEQHET